jgi:hypothetical protein
LTKLEKRGVMSGANGTPTFYLNGIRYDGSLDEGSLAAAIEDLMLTKRRKARRRRWLWVSEEIDNEEIIDELHNYQDAEQEESDDGGEDLNE